MNTVVEVVVQTTRQLSLSKKLSLKLYNILQNKLLYMLATSRVASTSITVLSFGRYTCTIDATH